MFYDELLKKLNEIPNNPYMHRKRLAFEDENIRELIFKGYTIPYKIDETMNKTVISHPIFTFNEKRHKRCFFP